MTNYRREIDGLRALAVIPVILFHAGYQTFSGGFVGVDIFFVISGYLITSIIHAEYLDGDFSLLTFYERRARRILPALFIVMLTCLPVAWISMLPDNFENFGESVVATTLSANNILLWLTSGYFELESEFKPLIHTWSLGVEEQFYLVFPLLLMLGLRFGPRLCAAALFMIAILSLALADWSATSAPQAAFFLLPSRMWELMTGALLALYLRNRVNASPVVTQEVAAIAGFLSITYAVFAFDSSTPFPGVYALIPTSGAALIIAFATPQTVVGRLLGSKLLVGVGLVSYSAYLWHQPLFAFARILSLEEPPRYAYAVLSLIALVLAVLTWRFVEKPFRDRKRFGRQLIFALSGLVGVALAGTGWSIYANSGFVSQWAELNSEIKAAGRHLNAAYNERPFRFRNQPFTDAGKLHVLVVGNSFARDFINAGLENGYFSSSEISYSDLNPACLKNDRDFDSGLQTRVAQADYLVFGSPSTLLLTCWKSDFEILASIGAKHIVVLGTKNFGWNLNAVMRLDPAVRYSYRAAVLDDIWRQNQAMATAFPERYFVNLLALIADKERRVPVFTPDGKIISQDRKHLTRDGARFVGAKLFEHPLLAPLK